MTKLETETQQPEHPIVFLDTNVLLQAFSSYRKGNQMPLYFIDPHATRFTFEKCIFESYMVFRGISGKKPDEGRGNWAQKNLRNENDPKYIEQRRNEFHGGDISLTHFWINQITEFEYIDDMEDTDKTIKALKTERMRFDELCANFLLMLNKHNITVLSYFTIFGVENLTEGNAYSMVGPENLDRLIKDMTIPSEDFEIVYAALRINADIFVTEDKRLKKCAWSLGHNLPLSPAAFCSGTEYEARIQEWKEMNGIE